MASFADLIKSSVRNFVKGNQTSIKM